MYLLLFRGTTFNESYYNFFIIILDVEEVQDSRAIKVFYLFWSYIARFWKVV